MMLELISGVNDDKLRSEFLKTENPTLDGLLGVARQWQSAVNIDKNFSQSSQCYKTSDYKDNKNNQWQKDRRNGSQSPDKADQSHNSRSRCKDCDKPSCDGGDKCWTKNAKCFNCNKVGHILKKCPKEKRQRSPTPGPNGRHEAKTNFVRVFNVKSEDDCEATPLARVGIVTEEGKKFHCEICPDTGSSQSIIARVRNYM